MNYRTNNCGELNISHCGKSVKLCGWVSKIRDKGHLKWIDLRDIHGTTQLVFDRDRTKKNVLNIAKKIGREFVIQISGKVVERISHNKNISTGDIEIIVNEITILNESKNPPFTIEDNTDGGDELRLKYRYLDIRRKPIQKNLLFRSKVASMVRKYLISNGFTEIETPFLIKSTPEGARDFIVPSRMNQGKFYALPQSPQTFKQLLMISGMEKYFQIVKCFRDEDFRSDRQPEFTQIDCEMSFVNQKDVMECFEGLLSGLLLEIHGIEKRPFPVISYFDAMNKYGSDKPDIRFGMEIHNIKEYTKNKGFKIFDDGEVVVAITIPKASIWSRKEIDYWIEWVKKPQVGSKGLVWVKNNLDGSVKSSVDKFYDYKNLKKWINECECKKGDLIFVMSGKKNETLIQMGKLRMEIAEKLNLRKAFEFAPLWVVDFPLFFKDDMNNYHPMHHQFTSPKSEHLDLLDEKPNEVYALAYDLVMNGNEIGGGSIRIINTKIQEKIFSIIGLDKKKSKEQFGFLVDALEFGAPPHGGIALGFDRLVAILNGDESIRDYIAFPKNNSGYDVMIKAPSEVDPQQLDDLGILKK